MSDTKLCQYCLQFRKKDAGKMVAAVTARSSNNIKSRFKCNSCITRTEQAKAKERNRA